MWISTECGVRIRQADERVVCVYRQGRWWRHRYRGFQENVVYGFARWTRGCVCVRREGRPRLAGLSTPPLSLSPTPFTALHTCMWRVPAMYDWAAVRTVCRRGLAMIALNGSEICTRAFCMRVLHDVAPMVELRSEIQRLRGVKSLGRSRSA